MSKTDEQFAQWLCASYPELFAAVLAKASNPAASQLSGWGDIFGAIGSGISSVASGLVAYGGKAIAAVGTFVGSDAGKQTLGQLASLYVNTQANKDALGIQMANLIAKTPPAPITTQVQPQTGITVPVYAPAGQAPQVLTPSLTSQLLSNVGKNPYLMPAMIGGGLILTALLLRRR